MKSLLPVNFPRDKKGSPLLPKDDAGFQAVGKQIMNDHFSDLFSDIKCQDKSYALAIEQIQQQIAMFVYFNRSDKPEYKCLDDLQWLYKVAREPMYDYDEKVRDKFFFNAAYAFLFTWFAKNPVAREFTKSQFRKKNEKYVQITLKRITELGEIAWTTFKACNVAKPKVVDRRYVQEAEASLSKALKATKTDIITRAEENLAFARAARRSHKNGVETTAE